MYTERQYVLLFFVYGAAFFIMGLSALFQRNYKESSFRLLGAINYLGIFGVLHGITEWLVMFRISNLYPEYNLYLGMIGLFTNVLSFIFLWMFGLKLLGIGDRRKFLTGSLPWIIFVVWILMTIYKLDDSIGVNYIETLISAGVASRYFIGLPGALMTSYALFKNSARMREIKLKNASNNLIGLSVFFCLYGILAGLFVERRSFFPSNIINKDLYYNLFGFPVELGRTILAVGITMFFLLAIRIFQKETSKKLERLTQQQTLSNERRLMAQELHDVIIQNIFASGLHLEGIIEMQNDLKIASELREVKDNLNETITRIRGFMNQLRDSNLQIEDLRYEIEVFVEDLRRKTNVKIELSCDVTQITLGILSKIKINQVYFIIREALLNSIKHSGADRIDVNIYTTTESVVVRVADNGTGFIKDDLIDSENYGLKSMEERAASVNGVLTIESNSKGTVVEISVSWEGIDHDRKKN
ncbi:sensor histidine kinase [Gudongella sp. SC589]|jgi:signal transduction histidine kinase|uniref:sensor histidine kinase n=1 Tax=Gudongella sp. SC589 TaxID=3385990 RepID=UPI003904A5AE